MKSKWGWDQEWREGVEGSEKKVVLWCNGSFCGCNAKQGNLKKKRAKSTCQHRPKSHQIFVYKASRERESHWHWQSMKRPFHIAKYGNELILPLEISTFLCSYKCTWPLMHALARVCNYQCLCFYSLGLPPRDSIILFIIPFIPIYIHISLKALSLHTRDQFHCAWFCFLTFLDKTLH